MVQLSQRRRVPANLLLPPSPRHLRLSLETLVKLSTFSPVVVILEQLVCRFPTLAKAHAKMLTCFTEQTTPTSGPNGSIDWLNCGLTDSGWRPPFVKVTDVVSVSLSAAISSGKGPFLACTKYVHLFEQYGEQFGLPAIMLASFAMQESSCNPNTVGGGGEQGLMQITKDKCGGAPGGNCRDPVRSSELSHR